MTFQKPEESQKIANENQSQYWKIENLWIADKSKNAEVNKEETETEKRTKY